MIQRTKFTLLRLKKLSSAVLAVSFLSACSSDMAAFDAITVISTDKTLGDHLVSYVSKKDCSTVRQELGLSYCVEDQPTVDKLAKQHCYRELGRVTCYSQPDYQNPRKTVEEYYMPPR